MSPACFDAFAEVTHTASNLFFMNLLLLKCYSNLCHPLSRRTTEVHHCQRLQRLRDGPCRVVISLLETTMVWPKITLAGFNMQSDRCFYLRWVSLRASVITYRVVMQPDSGIKSLVLISMFWFSAVRQTASALIKYLATGSMFSYEKKRCPVYVVCGCFFVLGTVPSIFLSVVTPWLTVMNLSYCEGKKEAFFGVAVSGN